MKNQYLRVAVLLSASALSGCQVLHCKPKPKEQPTAAVVVTQTPIVNVGGLVANPGPVELVRGVESLSAAMAVAGVREESVSVTSSSPSANFLSTATALMGSRIVGLREATEKAKAERPVGAGLNRNDNGVGEAFDAAFTLINKERLTTLEGAIQSTINDQGQKSAFLQDLKTANGSLVLAKVALVEAVNDSSYTEMFRRLAEYEAVLSDLAEFSARELNVGVSTSRRQDYSNLMVHVTRESQDYYIPYNYAQSGPAGEISLREGDLITVELLSDTALQNPIKLAGGEILVDGNRIAQVPSYRTLVKVAAEYNGRTEPVCLVLERRSGNLIGNATFILPCHKFSRSPFAPLPTMPQDVYKFVPFFQAPLISESLIGNAARTALASRVDRIERRSPVLNKHEKKMNWLQAQGQSVTRHVRGMVSALPLVP